MRLWRDLAHNAKLLSCQFCLVASAGLQDWELQLGWRIPFAFAPSWCAAALLALDAPPAVLADGAAAAGAGSVTLVWLYAQRDVNTYAWIELATAHHYALPRGIQISGLGDDDTLSVLPFGHGARRVGGRVWDG